VFVDQVEEVSASTPDDFSALRTVGVCMNLPDPDGPIDEAAVRRDVAALFEAMSSLAAQVGIEFAVEYREEEVGVLDGGPADARVAGDFFGS
jgi:hypothetical protein